MKQLRNFILMTFLLAVPVQQSNALIAGITAFFNPTTAGYIAISGLASPIVGAAVSYVTSDNGCDEGSCAVGLVLGGMLGLVLLEEKGNVEFSELSTTQAKELGIDSQSLAIFNSEIEEANILLSEVAGQMKKHSTQEDAKKAWDDLRDYVSPETFEVMQTISNQN
jgi:hypothetical protein